MNLRSIQRSIQCGGAALFIFVITWLAALPARARANPIADWDVIAFAAVAFAVNSIAQDGETTWFEGLLLVAVYALLALAFFFVTPPGG